MPAGNFDADRMTRFWDTARGSPPDEPVLGARHPHPPGLPAQLIRLENGVVQLLRLLRRIDLFKIVAIEGEIDFDLLGLLLAFDARVCDRTTVFENRTLERGVTPGFGVLWYLAQYVGQATTSDLVLNHRSLSAEDALRLKLVTQVVEPGRSAEEGVRYAEELARRPSPVLRGLAKAAGALHTDFEGYLSQVGAGFARSDG